MKVINVHHVEHHVVNIKELHKKLIFIYYNNLIIITINKMEDYYDNIKELKINNRITKYQNELDDNSNLTDEERKLLMGNITE